jgi:small-conductance mechanosensitive channel
MLSCLALWGFHPIAAAQNPGAVTDAVAETQPSDGDQFPAEQVSVSDVVPDTEIATRLGDIYESTEWFSEINVRSQNGVVTLEGIADTSEHAEWAANLARRTEDVVAVVNRLRVDPTIDLASSARVVKDSLRQLWQDFLIRLPLLIAALTCLLVTAIAAKLLSYGFRRLLDRRRFRTSLKDLADQLIRIGVWVLGLLLATVIAFPGMTPSKALTVLGLGSIAIGFAFKDIFENFFAGILILWRYPFDRGDYITLGELTGRVEEITIRNTLIKRLDGELSVVPNAHIFTNSVDVLTSQPQRRVRLICGVAYGESVDAAREVIRAAVQECESVQGKRTAEVFACEFADSSVNFEVAWWTGSKPIDIRRSRDEVVAAIKRKLDEAGIEIPFPYRTLTFKQAQPFRLSGLADDGPARGEEATANPSPEDT